MVAVLVAPYLASTQGSALAGSNDTVFVSRASGAAGAAAEGDSFLPSISDTGRFVAFQSNANNLSDEDNDDIEDIFARDLKDGTTTLVSRANGASGAKGDNLSDQASIFGNGHLVAFRSDADNLSADDKEFGDIFARRR